MLAAGLLAKRAVDRGLRVDPSVKTSLGPGSRVVSDYLTKTGCSHTSTSSAFRSSATAAPPASAIPGRSIRRSRKPSASTIWWRRASSRAIAISRRACTRTSRRISSCRRRSWWPSRSPAGWISISPQMPSAPRRKASRSSCATSGPASHEVKEAMSSALSPETFRRLYSDFASQNPMWNEIPSATGDIYAWDASSTYIQEPPFFQPSPWRPAPSARSRARGRWASLATPSRRITSPPPAQFVEDRARRSVPHRARRCVR